MATSTGTVTLRAQFANDDEALFPSEFVNIKMLVDTLHQAVLIPTPAVLTGAPGDYVYFVNADNTVSVRKVTVGPSDGQKTAILSGLAVGDTIVIDGTDRLTDGAKISVASPTPPAAKTPDASSAPGSPPGSRAKKPPSAGAAGASSPN
jgi:multidrug efflux system membrane fusion protein